MSKEGNGLYNEFIQNDFFEKKASENANIKSTLSNLDPEMLEKLAAEIEGISNDNEEDTLEQKLAAEGCSEKEPEKKEDKEEKESEDNSEKEPEKKEDDSKKEPEKKEDKEEKESDDNSEKDKTVKIKDNNDAIS